MQYMQILAFCNLLSCGIKNSFYCSDEEATFERISNDRRADIIQGDRGGSGWSYLGNFCDHNVIGTGTKHMIQISRAPISHLPPASDLNVLAPGFIPDPKPVEVNDSLLTDLNGLWRGLLPGATVSKTTPSYFFPAFHIAHLLQLRASARYDFPEKKEKLRGLACSKS